MMSDNAEANDLHRELQSQSAVTADYSEFDRMFFNLE